MSRRNDYAMPFDGSHSDGGLTIREYYAAHAPVNLEDANVSMHLRDQIKRADDYEYPPHMLMAELVRLRWEYADLMVEAGDK